MKTADFLAIVLPGAPLEIAALIEVDTHEARAVLTDWLREHKRDPRRQVYRRQLHRLRTKERIRTAIHGVLEGCFYPSEEAVFWFAGFKGATKMRSELRREILVELGWRQEATSWWWPPWTAPGGQQPELGTWRRQMDLAFPTASP